MKGLYALLGIGIVWLGAKIVAGRVQKGLSIAGKIPIKITNVSFSGIDFRISPTIKNESERSLPFEGIKGALKYGDTILAVINETDNQVIEAGEETELEIDGQVNVFQLGANITTFIQSGNWWQSARIEGVILSSGLNIDFNKNLVKFG